MYPHANFQQLFRGHVQNAHYGYVIINGGPIDVRDDASRTNSKPVHQILFVQVRYDHPSSRMRISYGDSKKGPQSRMNHDIFFVVCFIYEKNGLAAHGARHVTQLSPPLHAFRAHKVATRMNTFVCIFKAHSAIHFLVWYILLSHYPTIFAHWT